VHLTEQERDRALRHRAERREAACRRSVYNVVTGMFGLEVVACSADTTWTAKR